MSASNRVSSSARTAAPLHDFKDRFLKGIKKVCTATPYEVLAGFSIAGNCWTLLCLVNWLILVPAWIYAIAWILMHRDRLNPAWMVLPTIPLIYCTIFGFVSNRMLHELGQFARLIIFLFNVTLWYLLFPILGLPACLLYCVLYGVLLLHHGICKTFAWRLPRHWKDCTTGCSVGSHRLCPKCIKAVRGSPLLFGSRFPRLCIRERQRHHTVGNLAISAKECHLCRLLHASLVPAPEVNPSRAQNNTGTHNVRDLEDKRLIIRVWETRRWGKIPEWHMCFERHGTMESEEIAISQEHGHCCDTSTNTFSSRISDLSCQWITECLTHQICEGNFSPDANSLPTRLLDVKCGSSTIRLVESAQLLENNARSTWEKERIPYCALSHCWGGDIQPRLNLSNTDAMKTDILVENLPKNFQDAVAICRKLGQKYLWIDTLCIIQDSKTDKHKELSKMGLVYANAHCVISATGSKDSQGGCLYKKESSAIPVCILGKIGSLSLVARLGSKEGSMNGLFQEFVEQAPLTKRGWTFQERVLAKRILHFCNGIVLFECNTLRASEFHVEGVEYEKKAHFRPDGRITEAGDTQKPTEFTQPRFIQMIESKTVMHDNLLRNGRGNTWTDTIHLRRRVPNPNYMHRQPTSRQEFFHNTALMGMRGAFQLLLGFEGSTETEMIEFHNCWYQIIEQYSPRTLKYMTDKIIAIEGVVAFVQASGKRTFVAGLFEEFLLYNLLWHVDRSWFELKQSDRINGIPTWSWASTNAKITTRLLALFQPAQPAEPTIRYFGRAHKAPSNVRSVPAGWAVQAVFVSNLRVERPDGNNQDWSDAKLYANGHVHDMPTPQPGFSFYPDRTSVALDDDSPTSLLSPLLCLPFLSFKGQGQAQARRQVHGLVIRRLITDTLSDEYERVGYFWMEARGSTVGNKADQSTFEQMVASSAKEMIVIL